MRLPRRAPWWLGAAALTCVISADAAPMLHERIPADARDDVAMGVVTAGDLPAVIRTPRGVVHAPDPRRPVGTSGQKPSTAGGTFDAARAAKYVADTDTRRPDLLPYDEPFKPSTAPFKRLVAFDAVDASFQLYVADPTLRALPVGEDPASPDDAAFFADIVVRSASDRARIPSVGPGARVVHARLGDGARDLPFRLWHDGADNWFIQSNEPGRLVMEVAVPRAAFGGDPGDPLPSELRAPRLPPAVQLAANRVAATIDGVDPENPRRTLRALVAYFRGFSDSSDPPRGRGNAYLDLALSRKGVCRHRAYAFTVTALGLGIPTRMVLNEAHAWVEVRDGALWRRIDLGGAGRTLDAPRDAAVDGFEPPPDPYDWPPNAERGEDLGRLGQAPPRTGGPAAQPRTSPGAQSPGGAAPGEASSAESSGSGPAGSDPALGGAATEPDRGASTVTVQIGAADVRRGAALHVSGTVASGGEACAHVMVEIGLRRPGKARLLPLGSVATDDDGRFKGVVVVPFEVPADDYDVVAHAPGSTGCPEGSSF